MKIDCQDITYKYPKATDYLFQNLSFTLSEPGFDALFGPSGIGKTSLAKIIIGHIKEYTGAIRAEGMKTFLYTHNLERLPGWSAVGKHLDKVTPGGRAALKAELTTAFGVEQCLTSRFTQLSLGQQNRINLIRYLVQDFDLLIMDESLANVDEKTREQIIFTIKEFFPATYFLYISHNVVEVAKFCKEIVAFRNAYRDPQTVTIDGQNLFARQQLKKNRLERTMLEIMNAS